MLKALIEGEDLHRLVASMMLGKAPEDISKAERRYCKAPHFQHLYLGSPDSVGDNLWRPDMRHEDGTRKTKDEFKAEISDQFRRYDAGFPEIPAFWKRVQTDLKKKGATAPLTWLQRQVDAIRFRDPNKKFILTPLDRVINLEEEMSEWDGIVRPANWPTQSTAADLTTDAAVRLDQALRDEDMRSHVIGTIHDAIYVDTHPEEWQQVTKLTYTVMEDKSEIPWFSAPLIAEVEIGDTLNTAEVTRDLERSEVTLGKGYRIDRRGNHVEI